jgi:uncharacterized integral membrane protein
MPGSTEEAGERTEGTSSRLITILLFLSLLLVVIMFGLTIALSFTVVGLLSPVELVLLIVLLMGVLVAALLTRLVSKRRSENRMRELLNEERSTSQRLEARVDELETENEQLTAENEQLQEMIDRLQGPPAVEVESIDEEAGGRFAVLRNVLEEDRDLAGDIVLHPSGERYLLPHESTFLPEETMVLLVPAHIEVGDTMTLVERISVPTDEE